MTTSMRASSIGLCVLMASVLGSCAPQRAGAALPLSIPGDGITYDEQRILDLSREKWRWMSERDVDALADLFHEEAVFVHMGGTMNRDRELDVIRSGGIHYKHAEIQRASVRFIGETAIVLNTIRLDAVVGGNEVTNPFEVTEVYVRQDGAWKLASLSFTRLLQ
jgi:ketosteroid isomerase-like protein